MAERKTFTPTEKQKMLLSIQTQEGLRITGMFIDNCRDLARTQQKGGGGLVHQSIFDIPCIKLNSLKKGEGRRGAE